jgi:NMD protein affecting ribosome stability and mRNA decay
MEDVLCPNCFKKFKTYKNVYGTFCRHCRHYIEGTKTESMIELEKNRLIIEDKVRNSLRKNIGVKRDGN